jgi:hypothetical protein
MKRVRYRITGGDAVGLAVHPFVTITCPYPAPGMRAHVPHRVADTLLNRDLSLVLSSLHLRLPEQGSVEPSAGGRNPPQYRGDLASELFDIRLP